MFCCSIALFNCGGKVWFCDPCHNDAGRILSNPRLYKDCKGKNCPLKVHHPPPGKNHMKSAFPLGCSLCRSEHLTQYDEAQARITGMLEEEKFDWITIDR